MTDDQRDKKLLIDIERLNIEAPAKPHIPDGELPLAFLRVR